MPVTRRQFIRQVLAVGPVAMVFWLDADSASGQGAECTLPNAGTPQRFVPNEPNVRVRYSAAELAEAGHAAELARFREAIRLVRALPSGDAIGWTKQIAQHCIWCGPSNSRNIHFDWQFLPWHRGMLYFVERVLRKLVGNDELRLVYWDWENPASRTLPAIYAPPNQPLYWSNRRTSGSQWPLGDRAVDVQGLLALQTFRIFGGTAAQRNPTPAIFSGGHANVHNAFAPGDMADLQFSPRDPLFYAHHGNIDRLWSSWVAAPHGNPDFGDARVHFFDENRVWRYVLMNDLRDEAPLGYRYSSLMSPRLNVANVRTLPLTKAANRLALPQEAILRSRAAGPKYLVIESMRNLEKLPAETLRYGVFAVTPAVGTDAPGSPGYLGMASRVQHGENGGGEPLSAVLDVTARIGALSPQAGVELKVAPLDEDEKTTGEAIALEADGVSFLA